MRVRKYVSSIGISVVIVALASFGVLEGRASAALPIEGSKEALYRHVYWLKRETADFSLSQAKKLWEKNPSTDSKLLLGLAYVTANQPDKGLPILREVHSAVRLTGLIRESDLDELIKTLSEAVGNDDSAPVVNQAITKGIMAMGQWLNLGDREPELNVQAQLDTDRLDYVLKQDQDMRETALQTVQRLYQEAVSQPPDDPVMRLTLAKTAIYMNDSQVAQQLLIGILEQYPDAEEPAILLADILLHDGGSMLKEDAWRRLPQYAQARRRAQQEQKRLLQEWSQNITSNNDEFAESMQERLQDIRSSIDLSPHLAYSLVKPHEGSGDPAVHFLLSQYYFIVHDQDQSSDSIMRLTEQPDRLTDAQQYFVQSLRSLPVDVSQMSSDQLLKRNELTRDTFLSFRTLEGKRLDRVEPTDQEKSFAVHMSNQLTRLSKSSMRITSIQASENGKVELYVSTDNMDALRASNLILSDNGESITRFTIERLNESNHYSRNVMLIMDRSGSMQGNRISTAKLAVQGFLSRMKPNERAGLITFSDVNQVIQPLGSSPEAVSEAVANVVAGGGTRIGPAFSTALEQLTRESGERIAFILSDGEDDNFSLPETRTTIAAQANEGGVTIFSIGFGAGYETLREVSEVTGGRYIAATDLNDLLNSFAEISKTLESSYKLTYELAPMAEGLHRVVLAGPEQTRAVKTYTIGNSQSGTAAVVEGQYIDFAVHTTNPARIVASKAGMTDVQISGIGFEKVQRVLFNNQEIPFKRKSDSLLEITVSNNLPVGIHQIALISDDQREAVRSLSVTKSGDQQSRSFGYATIYGDFIDEELGTVRFRGNTSVDHFIYDAAGDMVLKDERLLSFNGLTVEVDALPIRLIPAAQSNTGTSQEVVAYSVELERDNLGKQFGVRRLTGGTSVDNLSLSKFGLELNVGKTIQYEAGYGPDQGALLVKGAGFRGFGSIGGLNDEAMKKAAKFVKILPTDLEVQLEYERDNMTLSGELAMTLHTGPLQASNIQAGVKHSMRNSRLELSGEASELEAFGHQLQISGKGVLIDTFGGTIVLENGGLAGLGIKLGSSSGVSIGSTGLTARGINMLADWGSAREGTIGLDIGTVVDGPFLAAINLLEKIPGINFGNDEDKKNLCVVCLEGEASVTGIATEDWSFDGQLLVKLLDFELDKKTVYFDRQEVTMGVLIDRAVFTLEGSASLIWSDYDYAGDTVLKMFGKSILLKQKGELALVLVAQHPSRSYVDIQFETWLFNPNIHIGSNVKVYR